MLSAGPSAIPMEQDPFQLCPIPSGKRSWSKVHMQETERIMRRWILCYGGRRYLAIVLLVHISTSDLELWLNVILKRELIACVF